MSRQRKQKSRQERKVAPGANRMPEDSVFFERVVPLLLISLGILMVVLILVAAAILLGIIQF